MKSKNKGGYLQISFAWLFAIIAGAFILFLAIYGTTKFVKVEEKTLEAKTGKEIEVLLNPLETGFETGKTTSLIMPVDSRIYNDCDDYGNFGKQIIRVSQKSLNKWTETDVDTEFPNKYIFSEDYEEGRKFYIFSKPFEFPFKVADLIYITPSLKEYCFIDAPNSIEDEILDLKQENLLAVKSLEECSDNSIKVCFDLGNNECDINVNTHTNEVEKNNEKMYFETDALMYAAIFSNSEIYECQLKRLIKRTGNLALLYKNKAMFVSGKGCYSNLDLTRLNNEANSFENSDGISGIYYFVKEIKDKNEFANCRLW